MAENMTKQLSSEIVNNKEDAGTSDSSTVRGKKDSQSEGNITDDDAMSSGSDVTKHRLKIVGVSKSNKPAEAMSLTEKAREVIQDVKEIKTAQATINNQLENIRRDNNHLYGDMSYVREKIGQQQIIVDKLLHFLMTMVGGRRTFLKRSFPYMLEDDDMIEKRAKALKYVQIAGADDVRIGDQVSYVLAPESKEATMLALGFTPAADKNSAAIVLPACDDPKPGTSAASSSSNLPSASQNSQPSAVTPPCQSTEAAAAQVYSVTEDIQDDMNALYDILKSKTGIDLPKEVVEMLFNRNNATVPNVPHAHLLADSSTAAATVGPVPIATLSAQVLEDKQITQQEMVDMAAQQVNDAIELKDITPFKVKDVTVVTHPTKAEPTLPTPSPSPIATDSQPKVAPTPDTNTNHKSESATGKHEKCNVTENNEVKQNEKSPAKSKI